MSIKLYEPKLLTADGFAAFRNHLLIAQTISEYNDVVN